MVRSDEIGPTMCYAYWLGSSIIEANDLQLLLDILPSVADTTPLV
jgi:hypothetical protein